LEEFFCLDPIAQCIDYGQLKPMILTEQQRGTFNEIGWLDGGRERRFD